jgi:hypothetical protein
VIEVSPPATEAQSREIQDLAVTCLKCLEYNKDFPEARESLDSICKEGKEKLHPKFIEAVEAMIKEVSLTRSIMS